MRLRYLEFSSVFRFVAAELQLNNRPVQFPSPYPERWILSLEIGSGSKSSCRSLRGVAIPV